MEKVHISAIGIIAGICTTISFIPQLFKILKTRKVRDISLIMYMVLTTGMLLWLIYGFLIKEVPIILANLVSFMFCASIVFMKLKNGKRGM